MRIIGWCWKCHRVRSVTIQGAMHSGLIIGVCDECDEGNREKPRDQRRR